MKEGILKELRRLKETYAEHRHIEYDSGVEFGLKLAISVCENEDKY